MGDDLLVELLPDPPVARITLNRPDKRNTITWEMRQRIEDVFDELAGDRRVRAVVVTGAGGTFSAGGDMRGFLEHEPYEFAHLGENLAAAERSPLPVIAAVDGFCFGAGMELARRWPSRASSPGGRRWRWRR